MSKTRKLIHLFSFNKFNIFSLNLVIGTHKFENNNFKLHNTTSYIYQLSIYSLLFVLFHIIIINNINLVSVFGSLTDVITFFSCFTKPLKKFYINKL